MRKQHFSTLKQRLISSEDFSETFDFFFQNFAEDTAFYDRGKVSTNDMLPKVIKGIGKKFYGENCEISNYRMTEIEEENFIHGTCFLDGNITLVMYFTDINLGLASISMGGARFNFVHLKATKIPEGLGVQYSKEQSATIN
ncbi:MAG: hypothetical protein AB8H03_09240 [Saprospiraceae bacterium]